MSLVNDQRNWFGEPPVSGYRQLYETGSLLHQERSSFQGIEVWESRPLGRMLVLDEAIQVTEKDEFIYHEMIAHVPLVTHPRPRRLLVVGGGDGGTLRRGLEHGIEQGLLVEIDRRVIEVCRAFLPSIGRDAFTHPTAKVIVGDGVDFVASHPRSCEVLLVDSTDPVGAAKVLFSPAFFAKAYDCLSDDGIFVIQSGSPLLMAPELIRVYHRLQQVFPIVRVYLASIPSYPGVLWSFTLGSKIHDPAKLDGAEVARRLAERGIRPRYYSAELHGACFALPQFLKEALESGKEHDLFAG
ncbi:MAG: polyamine aminopropyltransferase [Chloroflexi bacterium]|nr:polyamine aminopropyltransferase [Chloroflexota bacterium]